LALASVTLKRARRVGVFIPYHIIHKGKERGTATLILNPEDPCAAWDIHIKVRRKSRGKGLGTAAAAALLDVGFGEFGLERIRATTYENNAPALGGLRSLGFTHGGRATRTDGTTVERFEIDAATWRRHNK
jgi:RimJ/RimL family protein N-acetyltransferase